jgi:hypothetical protein
MTIRSGLFRVVVIDLKGAGSVMTTGHHFQTVDKMAVLLEVPIIPRGATTDGVRNGSSGGNVCVSIRFKSTYRLEIIIQLNQRHR